MVRSTILALLGLCSLAPVVSAQGKLQILNQRVCYGPLGATRPDTKYLPGDYLFMTFAMDGLTIDKAGKASYETMVQVLDREKKPVYEKKCISQGGRALRDILGVTKFSGGESTR